MTMLGVVDKRDRRDKRFIAPRRRVKLPWFILVCLTLLLSIAWISKRIMPGGRGHAPSQHSADAGASAPLSTDW
jgi:hypothetical protein